MEEAQLRRWLVETFEGVATQDAHGYTFFFVGEDRMLPFVTLANDDNDHDGVSRLRREGVYRLNIGCGRSAYEALFGPPPKKPGESGVVETGHDFSALDELLPHPHYATQSWVCVLAPSDETFAKQVRPLVEEAYRLALAREQKRARGDAKGA